MDKVEIVSDVRNFLKQYLGNTSIAANDMIFGEGLINSLFAMQLVLFLEETYLFRVENQDLDINNFKSLNAIADFVVKKMQDRQEALQR